MLISVDTRIPHPLPLVYVTYRDRLLDLLPYLPNVRTIETKERQEEGSLTHLVNEWQGGGEIPAAARAFLSEDLLSWTERIVWDESARLAKWRIQTHAFSEAVLCVGENQFLADGEGTVVKSRGELKIDPAKLKSVPFFMAGMVAGLVEEILGQKIGPNLQQMGEGVDRYLQVQRAF